MGNIQPKSLLLTKCVPQMLREVGYKYDEVVAQNHPLVKNQ